VSVLRRLVAVQDHVHSDLPHNRLARHVAIKIYRSDRRHDEEEARTLKQLTEGPSDHDGKDHIVQLLDRFELKGPNGRHLCLVLEALGPNMHLHELSPESNWEIAKQLAEATAYFQGLGIVHGGMIPVYSELVRTIGDY